MIIETDDKDDRIDTETGEIFKNVKITSGFEKEPLYRLWHLLYSIEENEHLIKNLKEDLVLLTNRRKQLVRLIFINRVMAT